jgi:hypothetical protein
MLIRDDALFTLVEKDDRMVAWLRERFRACSV